MKDNEKIDKIMEDIAEIKVDLATHIKRTDQNEENMAMLREEFKPVKSHVTFMNNTAKVIAIVAGALAFFQTMNWIQPILQLFRS